MTVKLSKKPLQIYLRQDQLDVLRGLARRKGASMAELIRQAVDRLLWDIPVEEDPLMDIVGLGDSGLGDLAINHDHYLVESEFEQREK